MNELWQLTIHAAGEGLRRRDFSSVELTRSCLDRIGQVEDRVKSFVTVTEKVALEQAESADRILASGAVSPLTGIPMQTQGPDLHQGHSDYLFLPDA